MSACEKYDERLEAFHDGELSGFALWRTSRHVAACARCRGQVENLGSLAALVREEELGTAPGPDLWAAIALRLPEVDAELARRGNAAEAAQPQTDRRGWRGLLGPLPIGVGGLAAAAVSVVLWLRPVALPPSDDVVEELDAMGRAVAVLPSDEKSTIIWVLDPSPVASAKETRGELL